MTWKYNRFFELIIPHLRGTKPLSGGGEANCPPPPPPQKKTALHLHVHTHIQCTYMMYMYMYNAETESVYTSVKTFSCKWLKDVDVRMEVPKDTCTMQQSRDT